MNLVGRPPKLYINILLLLNDVYQNKVSAKDLLAETIRCLLNFKNKRQQRLGDLLKETRSSEESIALSSEAIVTLIQQHMECPRSSRLPVLVVAGAYKAAQEYLGERCLPLRSHTSADEQTGALGDVEITIIDDENIVTGYEMKTRRVSREDIDRALQKISESEHIIDNYIFITTDVIERDVKEYADSLYEKTGGIEFTILDCIGFVRYFLHLFHRIRMNFLEEYQELLLKEPESGVSQELKEAFLALRRATESGD